VEVLLADGQVREIRHLPGALPLFAPYCALEAVSLRFRLLKFLGFRNHLRKWLIQSLCDRFGNVQARIPEAPLNQADVSGVNIGLLSQQLLRHSPGLPVLLQHPCKGRGHVQFPHSSHSVLTADRGFSLAPVWRAG
jgi:hypothetical protein